jgi:hypothetical protein
MMDEGRIHGKYMVEQELEPTLLMDQLHILFLMETKKPEPIMPTYRHAASSNELTQNRCSAQIS